MPGQDAFWPPKQLKASRQLLDNILNVKMNVKNITLILLISWKHWDMFILEQALLRRNVVQLQCMF